MKQSAYNNDTGLKVFEILKSLSRKEVSSDELLEILYNFNKKECSTETLQKYINTIKYAGLEIEKSPGNGNYILKNQPVTIDLTNKEIETLCFLENYAFSLNSQKVLNQFSAFINNLSRYFSHDTKSRYKTIKLKNGRNLKFNYDKNKKEIKIFEKYCLDNQRLEIEYKENNEQIMLYIIEPKEIIYEKQTVYLLSYIPKQAINKKLLLNNIISHKQLPTKATNCNLLNTVVFECRGRLAKNYKLKPSEKIINSSKDSLIISNSQEDRYVLLTRILKYGENAKILQPESLVCDMRKMLDTMIDNCERGQKSE